MKRILISLCALICLGFALPVFAQDTLISEDLGSMPVPVSPQNTERTVVFEVSKDNAPLIVHRGMTDGKNFWVPVNLLRENGLLLSEDLKTSNILIRVPSPEKRLGAKGLSFYTGDSIDLLFKGRSLSNILFLNIRGLENLTGLALPTDTSGDKIQLRSYGEGTITPNKKKEALPPIKGKINLVWDHVTKAHQDLNDSDKIPGLDVVSPTWFALLDNAGGVSNLANVPYIESAHQKGYRVWALVSNSFDRKKTREFLANPRAQKLFIARLLAYSALYELDGINVDFENVDNQDKARLSHFVSQLSHALHGQGITVSIDVTFPLWTNCYDLPAFARVVDYVMVMAYDEHWRTSPKAGSTASLPWVKAGLVKTLQQVPAEKLLLGIPFYTREWEEIPQKGKAPKVRSKALSMSSVDQRIRENQAPTRWLEDKGQNYTQYTQNGKRFHIWLEDEFSMQRRSDLIKEYNLAGAASWRKGFEKPIIWTVLNKTLKGDAP